jgi:hypothetical protein
LFASSKSEGIRVKIITKILSEISINDTIKVWSDNKEILNRLQINNKIKVEKECIDSNVIILEHKDNLEELCGDKYIFVLNYKLLSDIEQSFGALFWKKGRPNIIILEPRIKTQGISVSQDLEPYIEEQIW